MGLGGLCDCIVWYYAKNMKIYDDDFVDKIELTDMSQNNTNNKVNTKENQ